jgi:hypothetical protein
MRPESITQPPVIFNQPLGAAHLCRLPAIHRSPGLLARISQLVPAPQVALMPLP